MRRLVLRDPRVVPLLLAPVIGVVGVLEALTDNEFRPHLGALVVVAAWLVLTFVVLARFPVVGAVLVACFYPLTEVLGVAGPGGTGLIAVLLASGWAGYAAPPRVSLVAVLGAVAVFVGTDLVVHGFGWDSVFFPLVLLPARWAGLLVRRERERSTRLLELTAALEAQREAVAMAAAQEERTRVAREVHDAVAHNVSVMTLQIGGLRRQLDPVLDGRDAEREVMLGLERLGRETVAELRTLVGILREDSAAPTAPTPTLARVEDLVADVRATGVDVGLAVSGGPRDLPRALDVSAYRILQEALTNALRHAPGARVGVEVRYGTAAVDLVVHDDGRPGATEAPPVPADPVGGHGVVGMTERAEMFGGTLVARRRGRGYEVRAHLPVPEALL